MTRTEGYGADHTDEWVGPKRTRAQSVSARKNEGKFMATFIPVPDTAQLTLEYRDNSGKLFTNGLAFKKAGGWSLTDLNLLVSTAIDAWAEGMNDIITGNITLINVKAVDLSSEAGEYAEQAPTSDNVGTESGGSTPLNVCMTVTLRTALRGRSYRGRIYHTGLAASQKFDERSWTASIATFVGNAYLTFANAIMTATDSENVVISRQHGNVVLAEGVTTAVTEYVGRTRMATQRKRVSSS